MRLRINLDRIRWEAGEEVSGFVMIYDTSLARCRKSSLAVSLTGQSKCRIMTSRGVALTDAQTFAAEEEAVDDWLPFIESQAGHPPFRVPFKLRLKPDLAASFESDAGSVAYWLTALLKAKARLVKTVRSPTVCLFITSPGLGKSLIRTPRPYILVKRKRVSSGWKESGVIQVTASLPDGPRYSPGDPISLRVGMKNESLETLRGVRVVLVQSTSYRAKGVALEQQARLLAAASLAPLPRGKQALYGDIGEILVPVGAVRSVESPCCSVRHAIEIHGLRGGCRNSVCLVVPIEIL